MCLCVTLFGIPSDPLSGAPSEPPTVLEMTSSGCYVASRASRKLIEIDVTTYIQSVVKWLQVNGTTKHPEHLGSDFKRMLQRSFQSFLEVDWNGCYNIASRASWKWLQVDVTMLQRSIHRLVGVTWNQCYNVASRASWLLIVRDIATYHPKPLRLPS